MGDTCDNKCCEFYLLGDLYFLPIQASKEMFWYSWSFININSQIIKYIDRLIGLSLK